jgi:radical SAM enzyme (TIGR01210 family)
MAQRPPRARPTNPFKPQGFFREQERTSSGRIVNSAVILLTNKECPWRCLMCDLWQNTLTQSVPSGAIPRQIETAMAQLGLRAEQVKLYNSGSFFDSAAIPLADYPAIAHQVAFAGNVVVESHPRLVGEKTMRLRDLLSGSLEVAMGLETAHPRVLARLNKKFELRHFEQAADFLRKEGMAVRAFVLVKPPFMSEEEGLEWAVKSAEFAFSGGATVVSLIPTRLGNGAMERLMEAGEFSPPRLSTLEKALELGLNLRAGRIFADTWNLEPFSACSICLDNRRERLRLMNLAQEFLPSVHCNVCGT